MTEKAPEFRNEGRTALQIWSPVKAVSRGVRYAGIEEWSLAASHDRLNTRHVDTPGWYRNCYKANVPFCEQCQGRCRLG